MNMKHLFIIGTIFASTNLYSQVPKIGVFDADIMVQVLPGYQSSVESVLEQFASDSLQAEYLFYRQEFSRLDSTYRLDSVAKKAKSILDIKLRQREEVAYTLMNWERVAQYRIQQKRSYLAAPFYDKVMAAYKKVVAREKYLVVLKPDTYEPFTVVDNVFAHVAKELNVKLPKELMSE